MKIRKSFEQAVCILLIIATSEGPAKSSYLSNRLNVSDSYLKKIMRQLVVADLISSKASKLGGFVLSRNVDDITFLDIFNAIEGNEHFAETTHLVEKVFDRSATTVDIQKHILTHLNNAEDHYRQKLQDIRLADIILMAHKNGS